MTTTFPRGKGGNLSSTADAGRQFLTQKGTRDMLSPREMADAASRFDYRLFTLELSSRFLCAIASHDQREIALSTECRANREHGSDREPADHGALLQAGAPLALTKLLFRYRIIWLV
jgi:hypothetical protein